MGARTTFDSLTTSVLVFSVSTMDTDSGEEGRRADLEMILQQHRAAVTAFGLSLKPTTPSPQAPPRHHTIDAILGLRPVEHNGPGTESSGEFLVVRLG